MSRMYAVLVVLATLAIARGQDTTQYVMSETTAPQVVKTTMNMAPIEKTTQFPGLTTVDMTGTAFTVSGGLQVEGVSLDQPAEQHTFTEALLQVTGATRADITFTLVVVRSRRALQTGTYDVNYVLTYPTDTAAESGLTSINEASFATDLAAEASATSPAFENVVVVNNDPPAAVVVVTTTTTTTSTSSSSSTTTSTTTTASTTTTTSTSTTPGPAVIPQSDPAALSRIFAVPPVSNNSATLAFYDSFGLDEQGSWPYVAEFSSPLVSSEQTAAFVSSTFGLGVLQTSVLGATSLLLHLAPDQIPPQHEIDSLVEVGTLSATNPLTSVTIGTQLGSGIAALVDEATNSTSCPDSDPTQVSLLVYYTAGANPEVLQNQTLADLVSSTTLSAMDFMRTYANTAPPNSAVLVAAFPDVPPAARFSAPTFASGEGGNRLVFDVSLASGQCYASSVFYLSFYFAQNPNVAFAALRTAPVAMATKQSAYVQGGVETAPGCDYMFIHGLEGNTQIIGLADSGLDLENSFLYGETATYCTSTAGCGGQSSAADPSKVVTVNGVSSTPESRKVIRYEAYADNVDTADGHGTFMAGVLNGEPVPARGYPPCTQEGNAGYNPDAQRAFGAAPEAKIAFFDAGKDGNIVAPWQNLGLMFDAAKTLGAGVYSMSFGGFSNGEYTAAATDMDGFMFTNKDALVVVPAGNTGMSSVSSPGVSKNALTVGALNGAYTGAASFSAGGLLPDGRMKPDLLAPGTDVYSAASQDSFCGTVKKSGTSISTGLVVAAAALAREYLQTTYAAWGSIWGSTIKAVLIAGAVPLSTRGSNTYGSVEGYGSLILRYVLPFADNNPIDLRVFQENLRASATAATFDVEVTSAAEPFVVAMAYTDPPAVLGARFPLVNHLRLDVRDSNGVSYSHEATVQSNVGRVIIQNPTIGSYQIRVLNGFIVDDQDFSLVITGVLKDADRVDATCCAGTDLVIGTSCMPWIDIILCIFVSVFILALLIVVMILSCQESPSASTAGEEAAQDL